MARFPITDNLPSHATRFTLLKRNNLYYEGDELAFRLQQAGTTQYEVRNYYGDIVASGPVAGTQFIVPAQPHGWYRIYLTGPTNDPVFGQSYGVTTFMIIRHDARFPPNAAVGVPGLPATYYDGGDEILRGVAAIGPQRWLIQNAQDPEGDGSRSLSNVRAGVSIDRQWYSASAYVDPVRERPLFVSFPNGATQTPAHTAGVAQVVSALYPDVQWFEGPSNEPNVGHLLVPTMQTFYNAVKAGNPGAKVLGPNPVSIGPGIGTFLDAGGGDYLDGFSVHVYNDINGDLSLGRRKLKYLTDMLATAGFTKPLWQTEQGVNAVDYGLFRVRMSGHWGMLMLLLLEAFGIPKERNHYWYDSSHGYWDFPHFYLTEDGCPLPIVPMMRTFSEEVFGKRYVSTFDFGEPGNDMYLANLYTDPNSGTSVVALIDGCVHRGSVTFEVSGAVDHLVQSDCFGNELNALAVAGGRVVVPSSPDPTYVQLPAGVTLTAVPTARSSRTVVPDPRYSGNRARATGSDPATLLQYGRRLTDGRENNSYYYGAGGGNGDYDSAVFDTTGMPATMGLVFEKVETIDGLIVFAGQPWQELATMLDFDVQVLEPDGTTWTTIETYQGGGVVKSVTTQTLSVACTVEQYFDDTCIWDFRFPIRRACGIRISCRQATFGAALTAEASAAQTSGGGPNSNRLCLRELWVLAEHTRQGR